MIYNNVIALPTRTTSRCVDPFSIAAGSPVLPVKFHQSVNSADKLHSIAISAANDFNDSMNRIARALKLDIYNPGIKALSRIGQKAEFEKNGRVDQILDPLRCSLIGTAPKLAKALEFFAPANNSHVLELKNQFASPCTESGMRRAKIIYALPTASSHSGFLLTEIQLRHPLMHDAYGETDVISKRIRAIDAGLMTSTSALAYTSSARLARTAAELQKERVKTNLDAAKSTDLYKLEETRTFALANGLPFVAISTPLRTTPLLLRPDAVTGNYISDNSLYAVFNQNAFEPITANQFFEKSQDIVLNQQKHLAAHIATRNLG